MNLHLTLITALLPGVSLCLPVAAAEAGPKSRPNIILIMTDDQGYGDLACHANPIIKTPNLDRLHAESVRMTDFHVSSFCTPTRAALMTGRDPGRTGAYRTSSGRTMLHTDERTMADVFSEAGYSTGMIGWATTLRIARRIVASRMSFGTAAAGLGRRPTTGATTTLTIPSSGTGSSKSSRATAPMFSFARPDDSSSGTSRNPSCSTSRSMRRTAPIASIPSGVSPTRAA